MFNKSILSLAVVVALSACSSDDDKNSAPTNLSLSNLEVAENQAGATIGDLSVTDTDSGDTFTFTVSDDRFEIVGTELKLTAETALDYEAIQSVDLTITVTDSADNTLASDVTISVTDELDTYSFSNTTAGESSVSYSGQVARHILIAELNNYINEGLQADIESGDVSTSAEALEKLMFFYTTTDEQYDEALGQHIITVDTLEDSKQAVLADISSSKKDLNGKIAGNDATGQHEVWADKFVAFGAQGSQSPQQLIEALLSEIADNAEVEAEGEKRQDVFGNDITKVYIAADGRDLKQLVQKILLGAVTFSQGVDDYLDNDIDGKGLKSDNTALVDGKPYTSLEHQYDEGFGYFGAARDYLSYTDEEIAAKGGRDEYQGMMDTNDDGMIDFNSEFNFGHSLNAAKRDLGTADNSAPTDFTKEAMEAFLQGRQIIANADVTALTDAQMTDLLAQRDIAVLAWEKAIASTAVHYINDTIGDYTNWGTDDFSYADLAKHWSELKGFLVSLQFNPRSPLSEANFINVNTLVADAPVLTAENVDAYVTDLESARDILQTAYNFTSENVTNW